MTLKNKTLQKFISCLLIIAILSPVAFVLFNKPEKAEAVWGAADVNIQALDIQEIVWEVIKSVLMYIIGKLVDKITQSTIKWINEGFQGKPGFVKNPATFFGDIAKTEFRGFIDQIGYDNIKFPFGKDFALGILKDAKKTFDSGAAHTLSKLNLSQNEYSYRLNNFSVGGWNDFLANTQLEKNNFLGFNVIATKQLSQKLTGLNSKIAKTKAEISQGAGFFSQKGCVSNPGWNEDKVAEGYKHPTAFVPPAPKDCSIYQTGPTASSTAYNLCIAQNSGTLTTAQNTYNTAVTSGTTAFKSQYGCAEGPGTVTPGTAVGNSIVKALGSKSEQTILGSVIGSLASAVGKIIDAFMAKVLDVGLTGLNNLLSPPPPKPDNWNYVGPEGNTYVTPNYDDPNSPPVSVNPQIIVEVIIKNDGRGPGFIGNLIDNPVGILTPEEVMVFVDGNLTSPNLPNQFLAGNHQVTTNNPAAYYGYRTTIGGDCGEDGNIYLDSNSGFANPKVCRITFDDLPGGTPTNTGQLTIRKVIINDNGGIVNASAVPLFASGNRRVSGVQYTYASGPYTVTETNPVGYDASISGDCAPDGSVDVVAGVAKVCTITNNDGGTAPPADLCPLVNSIQTTTPCANTLCIIGTSWDVPSQTCLAPTDVCPLVNGIQTTTPCANTLCLNGDIWSVVSQSCVGDTAQLTVGIIVNGGPLTANDMQLFVDGILKNRGTTYSYVLGQHTVSEAGFNGYNVTIGGDCGANGVVSLALGDSKYCTITNNYITQTGTLTVTSQVVNDSGTGTLTAANVLLYVDSNIVSEGVPNTLPAGSHIVSGTISNGNIIQQNNYTVVMSGDCDPFNGSVNISLNSNKNCRVTFDDKPIAPSTGRLTVNAVVRNTNAGTATLNDVHLFVDAIPVDNGTQYIFNSKTYKVSATPIPFYLMTIGGNCNPTTGNVTITDGNDFICVVTFDDD
jgi:hypothetical protein